MGKRQWMWEKQKLKTVVSTREKAQLGEEQNPIWENNVFVYMWEEKPKREEQAGGKKQLFLMTYIERSLSEDRTRTISQPMKQFKCLCWVCRAARVKMKPREKEKVLALNFFSLSLNPSMNKAQVISSPCGPPVFSPLGPQLKLNLARLSDDYFAMAPEEEGNKRSRKLIINVLLYHVYLRERKKFTETKADSTYNWVRCTVNTVTWMKTRKPASGDPFFLTFYERLCKFPIQKNVSKTVNHTLNKNNFTYVHVTLS